jgi:hypothetical protein
MMWPASGILQPAGPRGSVQSLLSGGCVEMFVGELYGSDTAETYVQQRRIAPLMKVLSVLILLLMTVGTGYALAISLIHWSGIGV